MLYNLSEIEAIKLSVMRLEQLGLDRKEVLIKSIEYLKDDYTRSGEKIFLYKAVWHIYAYIELGFRYDVGKKLFEEILECLGINELFLEKKKKCKKVVLNKTNIRDLLGRWNPMLHSMKIEDAVNDIIYRIYNRVEGEAIYHCGTVIEESQNVILWEHTFKLHIDKRETFLHDMNKNKYYIFEEK